MKFLIILITYLFILSVELKLTKRVVGGWFSRINNHPYHVLILHDPILIFNSVSYSYCGGSIISSKWILTAAHCIIDKSAKGLNSTLIVVGIDRSNKFNSQNTYNLTAFHIHPNYTFNDTLTIGNDIALLELKEQLKFNQNVKPIPLPGKKFPLKIGDYAMTSGFGVTGNESSHLSDVLKTANVNIENITECENAFVAKFNHQSMICGSWKAYERPCHGDSGGGLVTLDDNDEAILIGITSFGADDCFMTSSNKSFEIYTQIEYFTGWIKSKIKKKI